MTEEIKWYFRPWVVIGLLFFVLGPFGLPLLYKSPKFNRAWKFVLTILTMAYTGYAIVVTMETVRKLSGALSQLQAVLG